MKNYYITTAITYPNSKPHIGHALEYVQADCLARYHKLLGEEVRFQTGIDEHGLKVQQAAEKQDLSPEQFVDQQSKNFVQLWAALGIEADRYIRTSDSDHIAMAQWLWTRCVNNLDGQGQSDIYKKMYRAWYDVKEETFLGSVEEYPDPAGFGIEPQFLQLIEEENYFFRLSRYTDQVVDLLESGQYQIVPVNRQKEMLNFVRDHGLQDVSISRDVAKLSWGVPVPEDSAQVMYVWFDALTNYLTGAAKLKQGELVLDPAWPAALHCVGKDIIRFHALLWPAMLLSAKVPIPKQLLVHGFILNEGRKMSKSLGNGVDPALLLEQYSRDLVRWYLVSQIPTLDDGDFSIKRLREVYQSDLANDYGNLVSRVSNMLSKYLDRQVKAPKKGQLTVEAQAEVAQCVASYEQRMANIEIDLAMTAVVQLIGWANRAVDKYKPWVMAKEGRQTDLEELLYVLLEVIRVATFLVQPVLIDATSTVKTQLFTKAVAEEDWNSFQVATKWGGVIEGERIGEPPIILFPRLIEE